MLENEDKFKKTIKGLNDKLDELHSRLTGQSDIENQLQQKYIQEIESRCKLADVYKGKCPEIPALSLFATINWIVVYRNEWRIE